ncbi:hypothetical protein [Alicyclobacillus sp. ALC3]|uniref:hypothetical protein n=1 Tax=Alicyclobacillus sp. ALC3 TaxID=2796143 RepID=UPI002378CB9F|nr:hypothetical protein [Alicyclobacillus sp. ALC3]WDL97299.1 hypothetical protein JC200_00625 [Alicyclobacillus sp. ALC3]
MSGVWHEWAVWLGCALLMGAAIKLMDDALDVNFDLERGRQTLAHQLGRATLPYALVLAVIAVDLDPALALSVFFGSYAVGMFTTWRDPLPSRLPSYVEIALALALSASLVGWRLALWGVAIMAVVDWLDDVMDLTGDSKSGQTNLAARIGFAETLLLTLVALCVAVLTNAALTAVVLVAVTALTVAAELTTKHLWKASDDDRGIDV